MQPVRQPMLIVVNNASVYRTLADLLSMARAKPGDATLANAGPGTAQQIAFEVLKRVANVDITYVPFTGGAAAVTAPLGGM
jgi:tripartite-type tricarboxylate transporter receptor subunit TctC